MQLFTVQSIAKTRCWINGIKTHLDSPSVNTWANPTLHLSLNGWVASRHETIEAIWLAWNGHKIAVAKMFARPDVATACPDNQHILGFQIDAIPLVFGADEPLKIILDTHSGRSTTLFEIFLHFPEHATPKSTSNSTTSVAKGIAFAPILAMARSGTTFLSQLLHGHEAILGHDQYPYEARFGEHLAAEWFTNMQPWSYQPIGCRNSQSMDQNFLALNEIFVASNRETGCATSLMQANANSSNYYRDKIVNLYRMLSLHPQASVIVEKIGLDVELDLIQALFGKVKPIFLIRDPRDVLLSMRLFNEKRTVYEFHESQAKNLGELLFWMSANMMSITHQYDRYPHEKILIRYEDLVSNPEVTLQCIYDFIGIERSSAGFSRLALEHPTHSQHTTAASPAESIGRWKSEFTRSELRNMDWFFQPFLSRFGY